MRYKKGDIIWVDFPFSENSQTKARPALIISNSKVNKTGDYLLAQITSKVKNDGLSVEIKASDYRNKPLEISSFVRFHKIFILNEALILSKKTAVTADFRNSIIDKLLSVLK